jgi:hypothetical protein
MKKTDSYDFDIAAPNAGAMIESLRAFGYDLPTAISDLIDNSIFAGAKNIWLKFYWNGEKSIISIKDDGHGMTETELVNSMRPGSKNPLEIREPNDLGRYGLGLKTASFSQCRRFTVVTKSVGNDNIATRCWDIDYVNETGEWRLIKNVSQLSQEFITELEYLESGTVVLWESIDRIVSGTRVNDNIAKNRFLEHIDYVKEHISIFFHRFLEHGSLKIFINNKPIESWDPYLLKETAIQILPSETLFFNKSIINVTPYVLPHPSKIDSETRKKAAGPKGWPAQQGFYVYRNKRLLVAGDWLGLGFLKEENYKLARILVDIPNSIDSDWAIDVKKSRARPPSPLRADFKRIAKLTREQAFLIYKHRAKDITREASGTHIFSWQQKVLHGKIFYTVNREHPIVKDLLQSSKDKEKIRALLRILEETIPVDSIKSSNSEKQDIHATPFELSDKNEIISIIFQAYRSLINCGYSPEEAKSCLINLETFQSFPDLIAIINDREEDI